MDLNALNVFITLYKSGSTQRAAKLLGRSQSFVSKVLAQLREELNDPLFIRTANGLQPTSYADKIAPKIQSSIEQINIALEPEYFDPKNLQYITVHIGEPLAVMMGKALIEAIRRETNAVIELRQWRKTSNDGLIEGSIDIGIQTLKDRPQQLYQKKIASGYGSLGGNLEGEFVKLIVDDLNEYVELYRAFDEKRNPTIIVDNYMVQQELLKNNYSYQFNLESNGAHKNLAVDLAIITSAARRHEAKIVWLSELCQKVILEAVNNKNKI
ncbi:MULTISPECIES: LysR family transcriptional regulator [Shewanella]|uniref:LysR family transcriptional regulator n=1 Tax=Shewanella japonica TaxID=93973 RepID=A0ABN4YGT2_9GAMM|nr:MULTISPECIES: LysR family transcriptional regulator [Shewanella]ARD22400.1 LysR family transcriptional regulator [Shewanella japonica]KPZ70679.1 HTH-type transcriptional regulator YidZ [Shewanella sp. P1-14-1]